MSRKDKYTWQANDVEVTMSQCSDCRNNEGRGKCKVYGDKPDEFRNNDKECPSRKS